MLTPSPEQNERLTELLDAIIGDDQTRRYALTRAVLASAVGDVLFEGSGGMMLFLAGSGLPEEAAIMVAAEPDVDGRLDALETWSRGG